MDGKDPYKREDDEKKKNDQKLSQLEQDILAKNQGRGSGNARPGVVAMTSSSASSTGTSSGASNLSQLEQDIASKTKASPGSSGRVDSRPGASAVGTGVSSFQQLTPNAHLSRLEQDIAAKTQARSSSSYSTAGTGTGTGSLSRLERDIMIKAQSSGRQSGIPASRPGVVPANTNQGNGGLSQLEQDIAAKSQSRGGAASRPGAVSSGGSGHLTQLEQDIAAKTGGALNSAARPGAIRSGEAGNLSQLERAIAAKTGTDRSLGVATAPARLNHLEQDAMAKTRGGSVSASRPGAVAASESGANMGNQKGMNSSKNGAVSAGVGGALTRFEQDIVTKTGGIVPTSSVASRNLSQLEQDLLSKARGSSAGSSVHHTLPTSSVLQRLEDDVSAKQAAMSLRPSGGGHSALMHMEQGISGNGSIATGHSFEPRDIGNFGTSEKDVVGQVQHQNSYDHRSQLQNTYQNTDNSGYYSGDTDNDISSGYNGNYNDSDTRIIDEYAQSREFDSRATSSNYRSNGDDNFNDRLNIEYEAARLASYAPGVTAADLAEHQDPEAPLYTVPISSLDSSPTGGIEAFVAENVVDATGVAVIKSDEEEETEIKTRQRKCMMWMTVAVLVLLAGVIVPVAVLSGSDETIKVTPSPTMSPTMTPTMSPTSSSIPRLVNELEAYSLATDLKDRNTPQGKAVAWIANDPFVINEGYIPTDPKFIQRYALAVFYFALGGESWRVCGEKDESCPNGWLQNTSDCSWFLLQCDDNGMLTSMDFST